MFVFNSSYVVGKEGFSIQLLAIDKFFSSGFIIKQGNKIQSTKVAYATMADNTVFFSNLIAFNSVKEASSALLNLQFSVNRGYNVNVFSDLMVASEQLNNYERNGYKN